MCASRCVGLCRREAQLRRQQQWPERLLGGAQCFTGIPLSPCQKIDFWESDCSLGERRGVLWGRGEERRAASFGCGRCSQGVCEIWACLKALKSLPSAVMCAVLALCYLPLHDSLHPMLGTFNDDRTVQ
jgi:hypothetical protein